MQAEDMILISVGDRVVEPPHLFRGLLPERFQDLAPEVITTADGADVWVFNGTVIPNTGLITAGGVAVPKCSPELSSFEQIWPGCFDIDERIKDMNAAGVLASMCFPSFPGLAGRVFAAATDKELALAVIRAYNDWHIDQWCGSYPGRFIPTSLPIVWDAELCAEEISRVAANGCRSLTFTENPSAWGCPGFHDEFWDPVWRALSDHGVVASVCFSASSADLLWSRVIRHFPDVRFALSEGMTHNEIRRRTDQESSGKLPSEMFRARVLTRVGADPVGITLRSEIGIDVIAWESDYPHGGFLWPTAAEELHEATNGLPDTEIDKITFKNACRWYSFDPYTHRPWQLSTVGALREEAAVHDVSVMSLDRARFDMSIGLGASHMASRARG